jgi:hypothetical protein
MKNGKIIRLVFTAMAVLTMAGVAKAEELVDFDGRSGNKSIIKLLDSDYILMNSENNIQITPKVDNQFASNSIETVKIKTTLNIGNKSITDEIVCKDDASINNLSSCKNQSSSLPLVLNDIDRYFLRPYFPKDGRSILMIENLENELRHSFTNCVNIAAGKQCFECHDYCRHWVITQVNTHNNAHIGTDGASVDAGVDTIKTCDDWSHECKCVSNCY